MFQFCNSFLVVANSKYKQRSLLSIPNPDVHLQELIDRKGAINGFGIKFCFTDSSSSPSLEFTNPLKIIFDCDWVEVKEYEDCNNRLSLGSTQFDESHFHKKSSTFHGKLSFANPITCDNTTYFYEKLDCLLQFAENGQYVRRGELRWKYSSAPNVMYPLDGVWEVKYTSGNSVLIYVQRHFFACFDESYQITIDQCRRPLFVWRDGTEQVCSQTIRRRKDGQFGPAVGDSLVWSTNATGYESITWKRLSENHDDSWRSVNILAAPFVYQRTNQQSNEDEQESLGPSYHPDTVWGNTFCQSFAIGLASYHFLKPEDEDNYRAYISYENPRTEA